ncbi:hypothetical protein TrST_g6597 [Triparma strigata]|uniref:PIPK domain-containing protein n=1 Tax=Triparma strigata TaxID=1606541 RepID=A0A9W7BSW8_9STRA|nr:hypothetical protein TrST_g6597 [Triparma strigata]
MKTLQLLPSLLGVILSIRMSSLLLKSKLSYSRTRALDSLPVINATDINDPLSSLTNSLSEHAWNESRTLNYSLQQVNAGQKCGNNTQPQPLESMRPEIFSLLRSSFSISPSTHLSRLTSSFRSFKSNSKGAARSGTLFFFSEDGAYLIKTVPDRERKVLLTILDKYCSYISEKEGCRSLLTRFVGMYTVKRVTRSKYLGIKREEKCTLVVMNSIFPVNKEMEERYDLKGSTVGRICRETEIEEKGSDAVLKDLNLASSVAQEVRSLGTSSLSKGYGFNISFCKSRFIRQLSKDVAFLKSCGVMDYSLLCGVSLKRRKWFGLKKSNLKKEPYVTPSSSKIVEAITPQKIRRIRLRKKMKHVVVSAFMAPLNASKVCLKIFKRILLGSEDGGYTCGVSNGPVSVIPGKRLGVGCTYYFGVIDFLQPWSFRKVMERQGKGMMGFDVNGISCVNPESYGERLIRFVDTHIT